MARFDDLVTQQEERLKKITQSQAQLVKMIDTDCNASINRLRSDLETFKNQTRRDVIALTDNNLALTNQCAAIPTLFNSIDEARKTIAGLEVSKADATISQDIKDNFSAIQQVNS